MAKGTDVLAATVAALVLLAAGPRLDAQEPIPTVCTYDTCALRLDQGLFSGLRIVRGIESETVARIGFGAPDLSELVARSDSAALYAARFESRHNAGTILGLVGAFIGGVGLLILLSNVDLDPFGADNPPPPPAWKYFTYGGAVVGGIGGVVQASALDPLHRAIWWYNRDLAVAGQQR